MTDALTDEELYAKLSDRLVRFASTIVGPAHAEDVVIEGVVSAMNARHWRSVENRTAYLYRSVLNAGRMHLRSTRRRRDREDVVFRRDHSDTSPPHDLPIPEVRAAVARLSVRQRAVIFLTYWEDLDERAVADRLGIGVGSVRRHLSRGRERVGKELGRAD